MSPCRRPRSPSAQVKLKRCGGGIAAAPFCRIRALHLGELLEESVILLEAFLGALEHLHRLVLADLLDELLEAVLAKLLRNGVRREGDGVGLVGAVERELLARRIRVVAPEREVDGLHRRLLVRRAGLREQTLLDAVRVRDDDRRAVVVLGLVV